MTPFQANAVRCLSSSHQFWISAPLAEQTSSKHSTDVYMKAARAPDAQFVPAASFNIGFAAAAQGQTRLDPV